MTSKIITSKQAAEMLCGADDILLICHKNPDGDTLGSASGLMHALRKMGKTCAVLCHDEIPSKYDFLNIQLFEGQFVPQFVVAVDVADKKLMGEKTHPYSENVNLCIDHHGSNTQYAQYLCCDSDSPAAAQLMVQVVQNMGVEFDSQIADCLYTGIMTDTGCFKFSSTTSETHRIGALLMDAGAHHTMISTKFFMSRSRKTIELEKHALNTLEFLFDGRCALIVLPKDLLERLDAKQGDIEGISAIPRAIEGVDVGITLRQNSLDSIKISVRTSEDADACKIAQGLGGGGHVRAAGCEFHGSLEDARAAILREVEKALCI